MNQVSSYRKVYLESAIKNVGLLADNVWGTNNLDKEYKQRNQELWIRFNEAEELGKDNNSNLDVETVKDRIPQSRLASYGDYIYDKNEEFFYNFCPDHKGETENAFIQTDNSEFWLCPEVEQEFRRLTSPIPLRSNAQQESKATLKPAGVLGEDQTIQPLQTTVNVTPSQWLQNQPWPIFLLHYHPNLSDTLSSSQKSLFSQGLTTNELKKAATIIRHPPLRYTLNSPSEYEYYMKLSAASVKEIWDIFSSNIGTSISKLLEVESNDWKLTLPLIAFNCEVPEFYPKSILQRTWQMLPSASDPNYQVDLFPYQTPIVSNQIAMPSVSSASTQVQPSTSSTVPSSPSIASSLVNSMTTWNQAPITPQPIPVFQRPPEFYSHSEGVKNHRKRGGVEFSNLILLGRSTENSSELNNIDTSQVTSDARGAQVNGNSLQCNDQTLNSQMISPLTRLGQNRSVEEMNMEKVTLEQINMWLDKVYPQRSEHFSEMMSTVDTIYNLATEVNKMERLNIEPVSNEPEYSNHLSGCGTDNSDLNQVTNKGAIKKIRTPSSSRSSSPQRQRRLYRDVLSGDTENRFAQLEQEALEQYQPSDHNISTVASEETIAQRFQDLEREALEQYTGDRDDWFVEPLRLTGEDNGGSGDLEEDPGPPITTPSKDTIPHREPLEDHQAGKEGEVEATAEENQKKEATKVTDSNIQESVTQSHFDPVLTPEGIDPKTPVWMKRKKKKQDKKRKPTKQKKDSITAQNNKKNPLNKFSCLVDDFYASVQNCFKYKNNKRLTKPDKKRIKNVMHQLSKINNLILNSETLSDFKLNTDATNVITFGIIAPCIQICLIIDGQDQYNLHDMVKRTIILKTFSMLFTPCFHRECKSAFSLSLENYRIKYMEILNKDKPSDRNNTKHSPLLMNKFHMNNNDFQLCRMCLLNSELSRLAWSCFHTFVSRLLSFARLSTNLSNGKNKHPIFVKNTSFYQMKLNNQYEFRSNVYYERYCNDIMKHTEWQNIGSLINENSGKYFINKNLYGLIKDWSWIYYLTTNKVTEILLIDSIIDETAISYFSSLITEIIDHTCSFIFQINWLYNAPCYYCKEFTLKKCFNNTDFIQNASHNERKIFAMKYDYIKIPSGSNYKQRNSRKSQFNNSLRQISNIYTICNNNEINKSQKINKRRNSDGNTWIRTHSEGALDTKHKYSQDIAPAPSRKRLRRNTSLPKEKSRCCVSKTLHHCDNEILHFIKYHSKQNDSSLQKYPSDQAIYNRCDHLTWSGDEAMNEINLKHQKNSNKLKKIKTKNKTTMKFTEKAKANLKIPCKQTCNLQ